MAGTTYTVLLYAVLSSLAQGDQNCQGDDCPATVNSLLQSGKRAIQMDQKHAAARDVGPGGISLECCKSYRTNSAYIVHQSTQQDWIEGCERAAQFAAGDSSKTSAGCRNNDVLQTDLNGDNSDPNGCSTRFGGVPSHHSDNSCKWANYACEWGYRCYMGTSQRRRQGGCDEGDGDTTVQTCPDSPWKTAVAISGDGTTTATDIGSTAFNALFAACPVVQYTRNSQVHSVYKRTSPIPDGFDAYSVFTGTWVSTDNTRGTDFNLYSSFDDASADSGAWAFCNYDDSDVAYPRDCGKSGAVGNQWFSMPGGRFNARGVTSGASFEVYQGSDCPVQLSDVREANCLAYPYQNGFYRNRFYEGCGYVGSLGGWQQCQDKCNECGESACRAACRNGCDYMKCESDSWKNKGCAMTNPQCVDNGGWATPDCTEGASAAALAQMDQTDQGSTVIEGDSCSGNDCSASVACPSGSSITKCEYVGSGASDGAYINDALECVVRGGTDDPVAPKATCTSGAATSVQVSDEMFLDQQTVSASCPDGTEAISCNCWSAWLLNICNDQATFDPDGNTCSLDIGSSGGRRRGTEGGAGAKVYALCAEQATEVAFTVSDTGAGSAEPLVEKSLSSAAGSTLRIDAVTIKLSDVCGGNTWPTVSFSSAACNIRERIIDNSNGNVELLGNNVERSWENLVYTCETAVSDWQFNIEEIDNENCASTWEYSVTGAVETSAVEEADPRGDFSPPWNDNPDTITDWDAWCEFELNEGCYACENQEGAGTLCTDECAAAGCAALAQVEKKGPTWVKRSSAPDLGAKCWSSSGGHGPHCQFKEIKSMADCKKKCETFGDGCTGIHWRDDWVDCWIYGPKGKVTSSGFCAEQDQVSDMNGDDNANGLDANVFYPNGTKTGMEGGGRRRRANEECWQYKKAKAKKWVKRSDAPDLGAKCWSSSGGHGPHCQFKEIKSMADCKKKCETFGADCTGIHWRDDWVDCWIYGPAGKVTSSGFCAEQEQVSDMNGNNNANGLDANVFYPNGKKTGMEGGGRRRRAAEECWQYM